MNRKINISKTKIILGVVVIGLVIAVLAMSNTDLFKGRITRMARLSCVDNDFGPDDLYEAANAVTKNRFGDEVNVVEDSCDDEGNLIEAYCEGNRATTKKVICPEDTSCIEDGQCSEEIEDLEIGISNEDEEESDEDEEIWEE